MPLLILNLSCENVKYPARKHFEKTNTYILLQNCFIRISPYSSEQIARLKHISLCWSKLHLLRSPTSAQYILENQLHLIYLNCYIDVYQFNLTNFFQLRRKDLAWHKTHQCPLWTYFFPQHSHIFVHPMPSCINPVNYPEFPCEQTLHYLLCAAMIVWSRIYCALAYCLLFFCLPVCLYAHCYHVSFCFLFVIHHSIIHN